MGTLVGKQVVATAVSITIQEQRCLIQTVNDTVPGNVLIRLSNVARVVYMS